MTEGQELALEQLLEVEAAAGSDVEIVRVQEPDTNSSLLIVDVSVYCGDLRRIPSGLPLRNRERFILFIGRTFPFMEPSVRTEHTRFQSFAHVQWRRKLCLYQAPSTEWDSSDGMFGFMDRLGEWLRLGALNQLDPEGAPLHPPVAYQFTGPYRMVIPEADAPQVGDRPWLGTSTIESINEHCVKLRNWHSIGDFSIEHGPAAAAILLPSEMPFEYPERVIDLFTALIGRGVGLGSLLFVMQLAAQSAQQGDPLYLVLGSPMRGTSGGERKQHLTAWYLEPLAADALRLALKQYSTNARSAEIGAKAEDIFQRWAQEASICWCSVREDRPEIVTRRDHSSPARWFAGKKIALWGCGALGSHVAEYLVRAGVDDLVLRDNGVVTPGILARQNFESADLGSFKCHVLQRKLTSIRPGVDVVSYSTDILSILDGEWTDGVDVIIDTTASGQVRSKLEHRTAHANREPVPFVGMAVGHRSENGVVLVTRSAHTGFLADTSRRAKLAVLSRSTYRAFANEFWPQTRREPFQPEPGCSDATFVGSAADAAAMAGSMLNTAAAWLGSEPTATAMAGFLSQPHVSGGRPESASFEFSSEEVFTDAHSGYQVRVAGSALAEMKAWAEKSRREVGPEPETGGLLFGERDDALRIVWVTEVSGPPPDSEASPEYFKCGTAGTQELHEEKKERTRGSVQYLGMWHTHPDSLPVPSEIDIDAMDRLTSAEMGSPQKSVLLIVGRPYSGITTIGTYVFSRREFREWHRSGVVARECHVTPTGFSEDRRAPGSVGLALSGGGSRAIAFHLGCLRALHDRGVLSQVDVISSVSGGSVIGAMYAYSDDSFEEFEQRVVHLLQSGLASSILLKAFSPDHMIGAAATTAHAGLNWLARTSSSLLRRVPAGDTRSQRTEGKPGSAPSMRSYSRASAFQAALAARLFGDRSIKDRRRGDIEIIINACELRTGTAFRFGSRRSGCWRFGRIKDNSVPLAFAVAASAAYPALLPAFDTEFEFETDSSIGRKRVVITDGGVYDNLGISCFEPDKDPRFSVCSSKPDFIICCDAGAGQFDGVEVPYWWPSRMRRSFEAVYRKGLNWNYSRLHDWAESGKVKGFAMPYLGQQDERLPVMPPDLILRSEVISYPTDFAPMATEDMVSLSSRGEQLTRVLIERYCSAL